MKLSLIFLLSSLLNTAVNSTALCADYTLQLDTISSGFDKKTCWVHQRAGIIPPKTIGNTSNSPNIVLTLNKLMLTGSDVYYAINEMRSNDMGKTWLAAKPYPKALGRYENEDGTSRSICDFWPQWHSKTGKLLGTGHTVWYTKENKVQKIRPRHTGYSVYDPKERTWSKRKNLVMPSLQRFQNAGAGSTQRYDLPNGNILIPIYFKPSQKGVKQYSVTVVLASFDGENLTYIKHGDELTVDVKRGFSEPSITKFKGRYYLTIRNDVSGYVTSGTDGLHFKKPIKWTFDDGTNLGNYNTQQHWVTHSDGLYLVYTRKGANNDHVMRHRAPLFMAKIDPEKLCVIRSTEQILVPEHGARLGNFGVTNVSKDETWVTVAEWMQTKSPNSRDYSIPMKYGSNNRVFAARILWNNPNKLFNDNQK